MPIGTLAGLKTAERKRLVIVTPIKSMEVNKSIRFALPVPSPCSLFLLGWTPLKANSQPRLGY